MSKDTGGPAFPAQNHHGQKFTGMTLRDYFAAKALMGMMASRNPNSPRFKPEDDAEFVYAIADAMLKARGEK